VSKMFSGGRWLTFIGGIILLMVLAGWSLRSRHENITWPQQVVLDATSFASNIVYQPAYEINRFFTHLSTLETLSAENAALKTVVAQEAQTQIALADSRQQNALLRQMLHFKQSAPQWQLLAATVTGRSPLSWSEQVTLSIGSQEGVKRNMPVLNQAGALVGRIESVAQISSVAVLITSPDSADGVSALALVKGQQPYGIVTGAPTLHNRLIMQFISQSGADVKIGDQVITSGLSTIYPKGIVIGKVVGFVSGVSAIMKSAVIRPAASMDELDDLFVLAPAPGQVRSR
jgi:rod shape-determining protein MreC